MTAVDASAIVAILLDEPEAESFMIFLARNGGLISPVGYWEAATRMRGLRGSPGVAELDTLLGQLGVSVASIDARSAKLACEAEASYGKRTPAGLNLGDCFAYALAREMDAPLLYKGDDFARTDIRPALPA